MREITTAPMNGQEISMSIWHQKHEHFSCKDAE